MEDPVSKWDPLSLACGALLPPFPRVCVGWLCLKGCVTQKLFVPLHGDPALSLFHHSSRGCLTGCLAFDCQFPGCPSPGRPPCVLRWLFWCDAPSLQAFKSFWVRSGCFCLLFSRLSWAVWLGCV